MQDPAAARPGICHHIVALGAEGVLPKIEWVARSMIGQWIYVFFHRRHPNVRNKPTMLVSLESTDPYQHNGASLVFMHCVVLKIQMFQKFSFRS